MFSLRRKPKKPEDTGAPVIRPTPSLPELSRNGPSVQWPEDLVNITEVNESTAAKSEFPADHGPISFHKPFRSLNSSANGKPPAQAPPSAFDAFKTRPSARRTTQRKARVPPTFNLMVCDPDLLSLHRHAQRRHAGRRWRARRAVARPRCYGSCWRQRICHPPPLSTSVP